MTQTYDEHLEEEHRASRLDLDLWRRLWAYTRPYRPQVLLLCFFGIVTAAVDVSYPLVTRAVIDAVDERGAEADLLPYAFLYAGLTVVFCLSIAGFIRLAGKIRTHVACDIRSEGFDNLQRLSFSYFDRRPVGWLMARMTSDVERLSNILAWGVLDLVWGLTLMSGIATLMLLMDVQLAVVVLAVVPFLALLSVFFKRRILASSRVVRKTNSRLTASYNEAAVGVRTAKAFGREEADLRSFSGVAGTMEGASLRNALQSALYLPAVLTLGSLATGLALAWGGVDVGAGRITLGTLIAFLTWTRHFFDPVQEMAHWFAEMQMAQASAERILGLISEEPTVRDSAMTRHVIRARRRRARSDRAEDGFQDRFGTLAFEGVGFTYDGGEEVLADFDLTLRAGETVALVGATGSGKSTIASLACRFYEPTSGRILLDGVDYTRRGLAWFRSNLGIVLQSPHLFSGTLAENIRYGQLDATDEEVREASRLAGADDFISALPEGYDTEVGEGGVRLSTGEKQLVSIARALLKRPRFLVLDEATSSIDTETEERIQRGLDLVLEGRTSLVIAHRLSTIRKADRILVIDAGRIVESGNHAALMARGGRYFQLYTQQSLRDARFGLDEATPPRSAAGA
ncbi:MAG: ABC transporter ATP-binding protein [Planctomycetota bacterium]